MTSKSVLQLLFVVGVAAAFVALIVRKESVPATASAPSTPSQVVAPHQMPAPQVSGVATATASQPSVIGGQESLVLGNLRAYRKAAKDYRQLVDELLPYAVAGIAEAQYEVARALSYCRPVFYGYFRDSKTKRAKTPEEINRFIETSLEFFRPRLMLDYQRCSSFFDDPAQLDAAPSWLSKASEAGYPEAVFEQAREVIMKSVPEVEAGIDTNVKKAERERLRLKAIEASLSVAPEVLFTMADLAEYSITSMDKYGALSYAWHLVSCNRGADCGPGSELAQNVCVIEAKCIEKPGVAEYIQMVTGADFDEYRRAAAAINDALDRKSTKEIRKFL